MRLLTRSDRRSKRCGPILGHSAGRSPLLLDPQRRRYGLKLSSDKSGMRSSGNGYLPNLILLNTNLDKFVSFLKSIPYFYCNSKDRLNLLDGGEVEVLETTRRTSPSKHNHLNLTEQGIDGRTWHRALRDHHGIHTRSMATINQITGSGRKCGRHFHRNRFGGFGGMVRVQTMARSRRRTSAVPTSRGPACGKHALSRG